MNIFAIIELRRAKKLQVTFTFLEELIIICMPEGTGDRND